MYHQIEGVVSIEILLKSADVFPPGELAPSDFTFSTPASAADFLPSNGDLDNDYAGCCFDCTELFAAKRLQIDGFRDLTGTRTTCPHGNGLRGAANGLARIMSSPSPTSSISDTEDTAQRLPSGTITPRPSLCEGGFVSPAKVSAVPAPSSPTGGPVVRLENRVSVRSERSDQPETVADARFQDENSENIKGHNQATQVSVPLVSGKGPHNAIEKEKRSHEQISAFPDRNALGTGKSDSVRQVDGSPPYKKRLTTDTPSVTVPGQQQKPAAEGSATAKNNQSLISPVKSSSSADRPTPKPSHRSSSPTQRNTGKSSANQSGGGGNHRRNSDGTENAPSIGNSELKDKPLSPEFAHQPGVFKPKIRPLKPGQTTEQVLKEAGVADKLEEYILEQKRAKTVTDHRLDKTGLAAIDPNYRPAVSFTMKKPPAPKPSGPHAAGRLGDPKNAANLNWRIAHEPKKATPPSEARSGPAVERPVTAQTTTVPSAQVKPTPVESGKPSLLPIYQMERQTAPAVPANPVSNTAKVPSYYPTYNPPSEDQPPSPDGTVEMDTTDDQCDFPFLAAPPNAAVGTSLLESPRLIIDSPASPPPFNESSADWACFAGPLSGHTVPPVPPGLFPGSFHDSTLSHTAVPTTPASPPPLPPPGPPPREHRVSPPRPPPPPLASTKSVSTQQSAGTNTPRSTVRPYCPGPNPPQAGTSLFAMPITLPQSISGPKPANRGPPPKTSSELTQSASNVTLGLRPNPDHGYRSSDSSKNPPSSTGTGPPPFTLRAVENNISSGTNLPPASAAPPAASVGQVAPVAALGTSMDYPRLREDNRKHLRTTSESSPRSDGGGSGSTGTGGCVKGPTSGYSLARFNFRVLGPLLRHDVKSTLDRAQHSEYTWNEQTEVPMFPNSLQDYMGNMFKFMQKKMMDQLQPALARFSLTDLDDPQHQGEIVPDDHLKNRVYPEERKEFVRIRVKSHTGFFSHWRFCDLLTIRQGPTGPYCFAVVSDAPMPIRYSNSNGANGYEIVLLVNISHDRYLQPLQKISLGFVDRLETFQRQLKAVFNLELHPLAPALSVLETDFLKDPLQPVQVPAALEPFQKALNKEQQKAFYNAAHAMLYDARPRIAVVRGAPGTGKMCVAVALLKAIIAHSHNPRVLFVVPGNMASKVASRICSAWQKHSPEEAAKGVFYYVRSPPGGEPFSEKSEPRSLFSAIKELAEPNRKRISDLIADAQSKERTCSDPVDKRRIQRNIDNWKTDLAAVDKSKASSDMLNAAFNKVLSDLHVLVTSPFTIHHKVTDIGDIHSSVDKRLFDCRQTFEYVFIYHAGRICELSSLQALTRHPIQKAVFIGDHMEIPVGETGLELPATPLSSTYLTRVCRAYDLGAEISDLVVQYGMPRDIVSYPNEEFYLRPPRTDPFPSSHRPSHFDTYRFLDLPEAWVKPGTREATDDRDDYRRVADLMVEIVRQDPKKERNKDNRYGILTRTEADAKYFQGLKRLTDLKETHKVEVTIRTVAAFQSRLRDIVIFYAGCDDLPGRDLNKPQLDLENRRICMAFGSACESLFIIGHSMSLRANTSWAKLIKDVQDRKIRFGFYETTSPDRFVSERLLRSQTGRGFVSASKR